MLKLFFKRLSSTHHQISYLREDGSGESMSVETKSLLMHDFIHYCLESEANLSAGFYGLLAQGHTYAELSGKMPSEFETSVVADVEQVAGPLSGVVKGHVSPAEFMQQFGVMMQSLGKPIPSWLSQELIGKVLVRYKQVTGKWNATPFGDTLELVF